MIVLVPPLILYVISFGAEPKSKSGPARSGDVPLSFGQLPTPGVEPNAQETFQESLPFTTPVWSQVINRVAHFTSPLNISSARIESAWSSGERQDAWVP